MIRCASVKTLIFCFSVFGLFAYLFNLHEHRNTFSKLTQNKLSKENNDIVNLKERLSKLQRRVTNLTKLVQYLHRKKRVVREASNTAMRLNVADLNTDSCGKTGRKHILSYSLFGEKGERFSKFIHDLSREASKIETYQTFAIRIYTDTRNYRKLKVRYTALENVEFCDVAKFSITPNVPGMFWRFLPMVDELCDVMCSRDLDSPLLQREGDAVNEWLSSGKMLHVMRDKQYHNVPVMGGMWCIRPNLDRKLSHQIFKKMISRAKNSLDSWRKSFDQKVLETELWTRLNQNVLQHDSFYCEHFAGSKPFPTQRNDFYVGCVRDCSVKDVKECPVSCRPKNHQDWTYC
eukprot:TCONS_00065539-protein